MTDEAFVVVPPAPACPFCTKPIETIDAVSLVFGADGIPAVAHSDCAIERAQGRISDMATFKTTLHLPDCSMCGRPYEQHFRPVTTIWAAYCDTDQLPAVVQYYRPSKPFRSRNWPYELITDSPMYTMTAEQLAAMERADAESRMSREEIAAIEKEYAGYARQSLSAVVKASKPGKAAA